MLPTYRSPFASEGRIPSGYRQGPKSAGLGWCRSARYLVGLGSPMRASTVNVAPHWRVPFFWNAVALAGVVGALKVTFFCWPYPTETFCIR